MSRLAINLRVDEDLLSAIDDLAARMGMNRSQAIRHVLRRATEIPGVQSALIEEANAIYGQLQLGVQRTRARIAELLMEEVSRALDVQSEEFEPAEEPLTELPALPARGEDIIEGEVLDGLGRTRRRRRRA